MPNPKIKMQNIAKVFETEDIETHALKNINLEIQAGDYISISGPSGCGKSTLLSILGLLDFPSHGQYLIDGEDVSSLSLDEAAAIRNSKLGFVFQSFNLIDSQSVYDNVALPLRYRKDKVSAEEMEQRVTKCLEAVEMLHRKDHKPNQLSGGQQQRVAIARALVQDPSILLVDEPTGNLDSKSGEAVMSVLDKLNKSGTTILMVTHDSNHAAMAKTQLHLSDGVIVDDVELREVV